MQHLLDAEAKSLLERERRLLQRMEKLLGRAGSDPETQAQLRDLAEHLDELFLVVVVGEFNAGKSSVLNAVFGEKLMREGPTPTTDKITVLRYGEEALTRQLSDVMTEQRLPSKLLQSVALVDTPGTNSIVEEHQRVTEDFIPRSDLVLFVTSYDRPLTHSEQRFLDFIREDWGREIVFVVNKADQARSEADLKEVVAHVKEGCRQKLGFDPQVFAVSAAEAFDAKQEEDDALWEKSRFGPLEAFITETLAGPERLALKLTAPLTAAGRILKRFGRDLEERRLTLQDDEGNLAAIDEEIDAVRADLQSGYGRHLAEVDALLMEMERRGVQFLDDTIRVSKIGLLRDRDRFKEEFEKQVLRDTQGEMDRHVTEAVDDLTGRALRLERQTLRRLTERMRAAGPENRLEGDFTYNRAEVQRTIMREAERKIQRHDVRAEARRILENVHDATGIVQAAGIGAAGLGLLSGLLALSTTADVLGGLGLATAGVMGVAGLTVLPRQRAKAKTEFRARAEELRTAVREALTGQLDREIDRALEELRNAVRPYRSFVEDEKSTLAEASSEHDALEEEVSALRRDVREKVGTPAMGEGGVDERRMTSDDR